MVDQDDDPTDPENSIEAEPIDDGDAESDSGSGFYWRQSRENLFSAAGIRIFQLAYSNKDKPYEEARKAIDAAYEVLSPRLKARGGAKKHGGIFATYITFLEEMGLMFRELSNGVEVLRSTPAGDQANILLNELPTALRVVPYFVLELLSRYRINNPLAKAPKNAALSSEIQGSDIFPYWSLYKIIRECDQYITKDELSRFVFKTKHMSDIPETISQIKNYREAKKSGLSAPELDAKFGPALSGAIGQSKYILGRAGFQVGVLLQEGDTYRINPDYLGFIDALLSSPPAFEELDERSWIKSYGAPVNATETRMSSEKPFIPLTSALPDDDKILKTVQLLLRDDKYSGVILVGPPGTGKTWYARQIAIKLVSGDGARMREVQFHPAYQYDDFVEGYVPDGKAGFVLKNKHLLIMCEKARDNSLEHVLVIDELSRTDPSRVFGEAMTYMERSLRGTKFFLPSGREASLPENLIFLATMNPEDRSVDDIDAAMDRRWAKVYLAPDRTMLRTFLTQNGFQGAALGAVLEFFGWIQAHYKVGHAFFRNIKDADSLDRLLENQLMPLFEKNFRFSPDTLSAISESAKKMQKTVRDTFATVQMPDQSPESNVG